MVRKNCKNCGRFIGIDRHNEGICISCDEKKNADNNKYKVIKKCEVCDDKFKSYKCDNRKFCSKKCANGRPRPHKRKGQSIKCDYCGNKFYSSPSNNRKYCSVECANTAIGESKRGERRVEYINKVCPICDEEFETRESDNHKLCSIECKYQYTGNKVSVINTDLYPKTADLRREIRKKKMSKEKRDNLKSCYLKGLIYNQMGIERGDIPQELVELKRLNIKRKRLIKKQTNKKGDSHV